MNPQDADQALSEELRQKTSKITYSREFLLSLGALDVCNRLPKGFDRNLLREFEDSFNNAFERPRSLGGFRPVNRAESLGGYSRGSGGRWDTRSSGSSDKDGDLRGDRDFADPKHFGSQPRHSGQQLEQDGLLGSGVFARPSGYSGTYAPRGRGSGTYQLNRSTEPYQPPRPYKAVPYTRKDTVDSFNDETFGSLEYTSEDKAEEERKRRASFELIRKEQQKALQDKQQQKSQSRREKLDRDIHTKVPEEDLSTKKEEGSDVSFAPSINQNDSPRLMQGPVSRPVVPPGFASAMLEKNPVIQSVNSVIETGHAVIEDNISVDSGVEKKIIPTIGISSFKSLADRGHMSNKSSGLPDGNDVWVDDIVNEKSTQKEFMPEVVDADNGNHSSSILEKLFGSALLKDSSSPLDFAGLQDDTEVQDPAIPQSSKFTHHFLEKEKKPPGNLSSSSLLSLIVSNEKVGSQDVVISAGNTADLKPPCSSYKDDETMQKLIASPGGSSHSANNQSDMQDIETSVLTCEDLEQIILLEVKDSSSSSHSVTASWSVTDSKTEEQKVNVDDSASQHLLSLLTKGTHPIEARTSKEELVVALDKQVLYNPKDVGVFDDSTPKNSETTLQPESVSTLGALFGAAFMNDLHSVRAPLSCQRGPSGSTNESHPHAIPLLEADGHHVYSTHEYKPSSTLDGRNDVFSQSEEAKVHQNARLWPGHLESSLENLNLSNKDHEEDICLPEENSLFSVSDPLNSIISDSVAYRNLNRTGKNLPKQTVEEFNNPLLSTLLSERQQMDQPGAHGTILPSHGSDGHAELLHPKMVPEINNPLLNTLFKEGQHMQRPDFRGPSSLAGPINLVESDDPLRQLRGGVISQLSQQVNHSRPPPPQIDPYTNKNPHMKFTGPEGIVHHDLHHSYPHSLMPQHTFPNVRGPQFDPSPLHPLLQHIMPSPHHPRQGLPRGLPVSNPPANHMPAFVPEMNNLAGSSFNHRQQNYAGPGIGIPGPFVGAGGGNGNPEVLQRLIEMEMRANQQQIRPSGGGHIPGVFGPELDMGFRYR